MATVKTSSSTAVWGYVILLGIGLGLSLTCLVTVAQLSAPPRLIATTSGLMIASRSIGGAIALAICKSILVFSEIHLTCFEQIPPNSALVSQNISVQILPPLYCLWDSPQNLFLLSLVPSRVMNQQLLPRSQV